MVDLIPNIKVYWNSELYRDIVLRLVTLYSFSNKTVTDPMEDTFYKTHVRNWEKM